MTIDINENTLALLLILMLAPILNHISKIKVGSVLEAEIAEEYHKKAVDLYDSTEREKTVSESDTDPINGSEQYNRFSAEKTVSTKQNLIDKYQDIIDTSNSNLIAGIVKLRYNLERSLSYLYSIKHPDNKYPNRVAKSYINILLKDDMIPQNLAGSLIEVIDIANQAIHGKGDIRDEDIKLSTLAGVNLLRRIDSLIYIFEIEQKDEEKGIFATPPRNK